MTAERKMAPTTGAAATGNTTVAAGVGPLERLVQIVQQNERLLAERDALVRQLIEAVGYLQRPGSNLALGRATVDWLKGKHRAVLAQIRANRIEAYQVLGRPGRAAEPGRN